MGNLPRNRRYLRQRPEKGRPAIIPPETILSRGGGPNLPFHGGPNLPFYGKEIGLAGGGGRKKRSLEGSASGGGLSSHQPPDQEKQGGGEKHAGKIEKNVVGVKAAAHHRLYQLDDNGQQQPGPQGVPPAFVVTGEGVQNAEGQEHQDVAQVFPGKVREKVGDQVKVPVKPVVHPAAGLVVEKEIPKAADQVNEKGETQQPCDIGDKKGGKELPGSRGALIPGKAADAVEESCQQGDGQYLEKVPRVGVEKEVLKGHGRALLDRTWPQYTRESGKPH